ncbi:MAG: heparinase, partial [Bacteroidales bacterium]|nr:heparinase [Bacteroidales bacterium]
NNESHNHNDVGTFSLYINETPVFIDVGVGTYTRQTFSGERYTIWTMQSDYHNLPRVNGHSQEHGQHYRSKNVTYNPRKQTFSLDISDAYPEAASLNNWNREYRLKKNELVIEDRYSLKDPEEKNRVYFLTWGNVEHVGKGVIQVEVMGQKAELRFNENQLTPTIEALELDDRRLKNVWGETIYRIQLEEKSIQPKGKLQYSIIKK